MAKPSLPLLTTVVTTAIVVCRECLSGYDVDSLSHVVGLLDGYLNTFSSNWTVPRACNAGLSLRALEYLTTRDPDWGDGKDAAYVAVTKKSLHVLKWLNECYPDRTSSEACIRGAARAAMQAGHAEVARELEQKLKRQRLE
ncbi:hypothetical protein PF008_g6923 [Phytophthora fragariae]|uniref:Uncharacterized protein n=1 Tax=Phytophthora fragariae TaxID=53985 RepID=A0A6G0S4L4_9STRA|nr:hypothetical protein PF008_g6923 [Phytophthora fragariae]